MINDHHLEMLAASGITPEHAELRGYQSLHEGNGLAPLASINVVRPGRRYPGLLIPLLRADGSTWGHQYRPDNPRLRDGRPVKYETPYQQRNGLDIPPGVGPMLDDPSIPLWITEGVKKVDCGAQQGLCIVGLIGVWNWLTTSTAGGKVALPEWRDIALNGRRVIIAFDGDVARKESVQKASRALSGYLATKGAKVEYLHLPDTDNKTGLDDYLQDHTVDDLLRLVKPIQPVPAQPKPDKPVEPAPAKPATPQHKPVSLDQARAVFRKWLGRDYDTDTIDAAIVTAAVERMTGDPLWLLIVSGSGNAKTETVQALGGAGARVVSSITSDGALLSATSKNERAKDATGGLLCEIGDRGVIVIKDVTSILSMDRNLRGRVLAALREIYDGYWSRDVGTDGGRSLKWSGRIAVVGAVTTAWDTHHSVIATMGDRFVLIRSDSSTGRVAAMRRAIGNTGDEQQMRSEMAGAVAGVMAGMSSDAIKPSDAEIDVIGAAADLVTLARTAVERDYQGNVIDAHAPEMPTRFAKQLAQVLRGGVAIGMDRGDALRLAIRCARDSMPPLRLAIIDYVWMNPHSSTQEVRRELDKPRRTVDRELQALHMLGVLKCDEEPYGPDDDKMRWYYTVAEHINPNAINLQSWPEKLLTTPTPLGDRDTQGRGNGGSAHLHTHISGQLSVDAPRAICTANDCDEPLTQPESIAAGVCCECRMMRGIL